jgi:hypothetical protein
LSNYLINEEQSRDNDVSEIMCSSYGSGTSRLPTQETSNDIPSSSQHSSSLGSELKLDSILEILRENNRRIEALEKKIDLTSQKTWDLSNSLMKMLSNGFHFLFDRLGLSGYVFL